MKYFGDAFRFGPAVNLFEKLVVKEGEVACLLAQSYIGMSEFSRPSSAIKEADHSHALADEEVKAVRVLQAALQNHPQSYSLLHVQCDFLRSKDKHEWALKLAKQAVNCAPSEFVTWAKLTEVNMELGRFSDVGCPLPSTACFSEADLVRRRLFSLSTPAPCSPTTSETFTACQHQLALISL